MIVRAPTTAALASAASLLVALTATAQPASAEVHWALGAGPALQLGGSPDQRVRLAAGLDVLPGGRLASLGFASLGFGASVRTPIRGAWLVSAAVLFQAAASRPRLAVTPYLELGATTRWHPAVGVGIRTVVGVFGPVAATLDTGGQLVVDGVDSTSLQFAIALRLGAAR